MNAINSKLSLDLGEPAEAYGTENHIDDSVYKSLDIYSQANILKIKS